MSALHRQWVIEQATEYRAQLAVDLKRRAHLMRMFRVAEGRVFYGYEERLEELRVTRRRVQSWHRRIQELEQQL